MRFVKDYRLTFSCVESRNILVIFWELEKSWKRVHQRELIMVFTKTNKNIDDLSSIRFQGTDISYHRSVMLFATPPCDTITFFNSPFRKGKVEVVVAWTSSLDFSERSPPFFLIEATRNEAGYRVKTLALNLRRNNKVFRTIAKQW